MMRKIYLKLLVLTCLMAMLCMVPAASAQAATTADKATARYNKYISQHKPNDYAIVDLDGNKIPELICTVSLKAYVYTYNQKKGKMVKLCSYEDIRGYGSYYNRNTHQVVLQSSNTGGAVYKIYKFTKTKKGTKATLQTTYKSVRNYYATNLDKRYTYYKNGSKISNNTFLKKINSIWKWAEVKGQMG